MGMGNLTRPFRSSRKRLAATALTVVALFSVAVTAIALAITDGGYDIDGDVPDSTGFAFFPDPVGAVKELGPENGSDTKVDVIDNAAPPMLDFTDVNGGLDLSGMWLDTTVDPATGDVWLYFAWQRESATTGFIAFEFQRSKQPAACNYTGVNQVETNPLNAATAAFIATCNPWANRAVGDFMLFWDLQGNSTDLYTRDYNGTDFDDPELIADANAEFGPNLLTGEAAINLTASGILPSGSNATECITFANVIAATVTGNSNTADFKDTILADTSGVGISNCGQVRVKKDTNPDNQSGVFPYTLARADNSSLRFGTPVLSIPGELNNDEESDLIVDLKTGTNYTLTEGALAPEWTKVSISCTKGEGGTTYNVYPGGQQFAVDASTVTDCLITNELKPKIKVTKVLNPAGDAGTFDLTIGATTFNNGGAGFGHNGTTGFQNVTAGGHVVSEAAHAGTTLSNYSSSYVCTKNGGAYTSGNGTLVSGGVDVVSGDSVECTFTNTRLPKLALVKVVTNDNGGTAVATDWTLSATAGANPVISGAGGAPSQNAVPNVQYTLAETTGPAGYTAAAAWVCTGTGGTFASPDKITLAPGADVSCSITNNDIPPQLHLRKVVTNDNGGTATVANFTLTANGTGANDLSGVSPVDSGAGLLADTWALSETNVAGYSNQGWVCVGGTQEGSNITVGIGGSATCTITNNDIPPQLHLRKVVTNDNGGTATVANFTLTANGTGANDLSGVSPVDSGAGLLADTWALSETNVAGYSNQGWVCVGGTQEGSNITVGIGGSATCTITNNDIPPQLHLRKVVTNDNGGTATVANFTLTANGTGANDLSGVSPVDSGAGLLADTWALSETNVAGYSNQGWVCVGGTQEGSNITVGIGGSATCTITNNDIPPQLHLRKVVTNDNGGTATVANFTLTANGTGANDLSGVSPVDSGAGLLADTWALSETNVAGYSNQGWVCVGGTQEGSNITVGIGGSATCTITNNDIPPGLTLNKVVVNNNGGTALESAWTLSAAGPSPLSGPGAAGSDDVVSNPATFATGTYTLSESTGPAGYSASDWVCTGTGTQGTGDDKNKITIGLGQNAHCTVTNDDIAPKLHLRKVVTNDNGGTATVADFTLTANGSGANDLSGISPVDSGPGLDADTWALSETPLAGYTASAWVCVGGSQEGASITLGLDEEATCTITNDDIAPKLHLRKVVTNDNGGTATVADFTLTANGSGANDLSGISPVDSDGTLDADTWALSETPVAGYAASDWVCVGGSQEGASITVGIGGEATCTITNDDIAPKLHLRKVVTNDNGGTATVADFTLTANGSGANDLSGISPVDSGPGLDADTWALSETPLAGYTASAWVCVGGSQEGASITLGLDEEATCTITNDDIAPKLHLRKVVTNDNGGTATVADFTLTANGSGANDLSGISPVDSDGTLDADTWALSETPVAGYAASDWVCVGGSQEGASITVGIGGEATCTITNDDIAPKLTLIKKVVGSDEPVTSWTLTADGADDNDVSGQSPVVSDEELAAGTFALSESGPPGYDQSPWTCQGEGGTQEGSSITLALAADVTCEITNSKRPLVRVIKNLEPAEDPGKFNLQINGVTFAENVSDGGDTGFHDVDVPTVTVGEAQGTGTKLSSYASSVSCDNQTGNPDGTEHQFAVGYGDVVTCTITNTRKPSSIDVIKTANPTHVNEPGADVEFTVKVTNTSAVDVVTITKAGFTDAVDGGATLPITDIDCDDDAETDLEFPIALDPNESVTCTFTKHVSGNAGDIVEDVVEVTGKDETGRDVSDDDPADVTIDNVPSQLVITKDPNTPTVPEPGGPVTYTVVVTNPASNVDVITIQKAGFTDMVGAGPDEPITDIDCLAGAGDGFPVVLNPSDSVTCTFVKAVTGDPGDVIHDVVTVKGTDDDGDAVQDDDPADVTIVDVESSIDVTKTPNPASLPENGGLVTYTVVVTNTSDVDDVTFTADGFVDKVNKNAPANDGVVTPITDLHCAGGAEGDLDGLPQTLEPDESITCTFTMQVTGNAGDDVNDRITVTGTDDDGDPVSDFAEATVEITDVPSILQIVKTANPTVIQESGSATFTFVITNPLQFQLNGQTITTVDSITINTLTDTDFNLLQEPTTCENVVGTVLDPGESVTCSITRTVSGNPSNPHQNTATVTGTDDDGQPKTASDDATVTFTNRPPPPYEPKIDIAVQKTATPQVTLPLGGGTSAITYSLSVRNNGPDPATNVKVADAAPAGVTFVSATTSKGNCTTTALALDCTISALAVGESTAITINATVNRTGTFVNVVTATGSGGPDTNPGNNTAQASTLVIAPAVPPKPRPEPEICDTLTVTQKMLKANGTKQTIRAKVTEAGKAVKGARVVISGPGIKKTGRTNARGFVTFVVQPTKPGIIRVEIKGAKACNTQRIGVVGVFEPPVTG